MKRSAFGIFVAILLLVASGAEGSSREKMKKGNFALSLNGGLGFINGGDLNQMVQDWDKFFTDSNGTSDSSFDWSQFKSRPKFGIELFYYFSDRIALSLGFEYMKKKNIGQVDLNDSDSVEGTIDEYPYRYNTQSRLGFDPQNTLSTLPITLNAYYFLPLGRRSQFFIEAGFGYYLSKLKSVYHYNLEKTEELELYDPDNGSLLDVYINEEKYNAYHNDSAKSNVFGFHGGLGLELNISSRLSLVLEGIYRTVAHKNWKGTASENLSYQETYGSQSEGYTQNTESESNSYDGQLLYITYSDGTSIVSIDNPGESKSRGAVVKLSGPSLKVSFKVRF